MSARIELTEDIVLKSLLFEDLYFFTRYFFKQNTGKKFVHGEHFKKMSDVLEKVYTHEITRLVINIPPRFGKTEMAVINFVAKGLMINPAAKFIHTSYSDSLALDNSEKIKELIQSDSYQKINPIKIKKDSSSKAKWYTEAGGGVYATSSGGQITGFGAGIINIDTFGGAIIIDDPLKPLDAYSEVVRESINDRFFSTILSRVNNPNTPIIVIMQRLHENDLSGVLLKKGGWYHLNMPAVNDDGTYLWDYRKETVEEIKDKMPYVFMTQYQQTPIMPKTGDMFFYSYADIFFIPDIIPVDQTATLDIGFDFNKDPVAATIGQLNIRTYEPRLIEKVTANEKLIPGKSPLEAVCSIIYKKYIESGKFHPSQLRVTCDPSGTQGGADFVANRSMITTIIRELKLNQGQVRVRRSHNTHQFNGELINYFFRVIGDRFKHNIPELHEEFHAVFRDDKGTYNTAKAKYGLHILDSCIYLLDMWLCHINGSYTNDFKRITSNIDNNIKRVSK